MSITDISYDDLRNLTIGSVESVSPSEIKILLDINAPQNTSLNTGEPTLFPKINGYVLIPNEAGSLICIISYLGVELSSYPKRKGLKDFDLIDLPFPLRKMSVNPLGIIKKENDGSYKIDRGVYSYPSIGDSVVIPTRKQLESIVENKDKNAQIKIGVSPLAANANVYVDADKIFGRHIAILGNTGSGKSCSVAGLIRWSLISAKKNNKNSDKDKLNARFIILDPNGEYSNAFDDFSPRKFQVFLREDKNSQQLEVPIWMWNSYEWSAVVQASSRAQRPLLRQTLRAMRNNLTSPEESINFEIKRYLATILISIKTEKNSGTPWGTFPRPKNFTEKLRKWKESIEDYLSKIPESEEREKLNNLNIELTEKLDKRSAQFPIWEFSSLEVNDIQKRIEEAFEKFGGCFDELMIKSEDAPIPFNSDDFINYFKALADEKDATQFVDYLLMRIRTMLADSRMSSIIKSNSKLSLQDWLENYIGKNNSENGQIAILDLSIVPNDILHIVISVIARIIFEALQRYRRQNKRGEILPTVLVMEEAHNFITKYSSDIEELSPSALCSKTFEKIAKEGRKFGLGLVLSSQRPSELSSTVLSQCNTFLLHRLVNDRDQELVKKLVPDNLGAILNELPTLPTRKAILLGWAAPVPILIEINELDTKFRPHSEDPDFWDVWTGLKSRPIDWSKIVKEWQSDNTCNTEE